jgi:hypothetical protein
MASEARVTPVVMEVLAGLADLLAAEGASSLARELVEHILATPAGGQAARDRAERLREKLADLSVPSRPLERVVESVWMVR